MSDVTSPRGLKMLSYMPEFLQSDIFKSMIQAKGIEYDSLRAAIADVAKQYFITTATWGLSKWEKEFKLPVDTSLSYADRRARVLSAKNSTPNTNLAMVKKIIQSFTGVTPTVYEKDTFRAGQSKAGDHIYDPNHLFTIRRKFIFIAGFSAAGDQVYETDYQTAMVVNVTQVFRAGYSVAGDKVYSIDPNYSYLQNGNIIDKNVLRAAIEKVLPARMNLIIN